MNAGIVTSVSVSHGVFLAAGGWTLLCGELLLVIREIARVVEIVSSRASSLA